jgi:uncharacterized membrane protein YphA (DoxX/SURF4 family)
MSGLQDLQHALPSVAAFAGRADVLLVAKYFMFAIFAYAGWTKLSNPAPIASTLAALGFTKLPQPIVGRLLGVLEVAVGAVIAIGPTDKVGGVAALCMSLVFLVVLVSALGNHIKVTCSCFGPDDEQITTRTVLRTALIALVAAYLTSEPSAIEAGPPFIAGADSMTLAIAIAALLLLVPVSRKTWQLHMDAVSRVPWDWVIAQTEKSKT